VHLRQEGSPIFQGGPAKVQARFRKQMDRRLPVEAQAGAPPAPSGLPFPLESPSSNSNRRSARSTRWKPMGSGCTVNFFSRRPHPSGVPCPASPNF
jgi:hypothetical protein